MKYEDLISKYHNFIYHGFRINQTDNYLEVVYDFEIEGLSHFNPSFSINRNIISNNNINEDVLNYLIFNIGMVESISYYKITCPKTYIIKDYYLTELEQKWWSKLFFLGLGEFLYKNDIKISQEDLVIFKPLGNKRNVKDENFNPEGNLIPVGGGKDSCVTLELLKGMDNIPFTINSKDVHKMCINAAGYNDWYNVNRVLDRKVIQFNEKGFLNGHTPFSGIVAFYSLLVAYLTNRKNIILSNEDSANEPTVIGSFVNHQYSKSFEFEQDFASYVKDDIGLNINYFSLLRPIKEIKIAYLFSKYKKYHKLFKSCNIGSKQEPWQWCCSCPKCLFVFIILSAFLPLDYLTDLFGKNLYLDDTLLETYKELLGYSDTKPFECVGEVDEAKWAVSKAIENNKDNLPYLLKYYQDNYPLFKSNLMDSFNNDNLIPKEFDDIKKELMSND